MTERRYEVSFVTGPFTDRQVEHLADALWELGYDNLCFRPRPQPYRVSDRDALRNAEQHELARELKH